MMMKKKNPELTTGEISQNLQVLQLGLDGHVSLCVDKACQIKKEC